jgi:hypothetical protein
MSKIKLTGESSGYVEISAGSNAGNNTLELPTSGTRLIASDSDGNVTIGGTLTYSDVTNVDSVGVVTARSGIRVTDGSIGIGTDNPEAPIHIVGTNGILLDDSTNGKRLDVRCKSDVAELNAYDPTDSNAEVPIVVKQYTTERIRILSDGTVGIGSTTSSTPVTPPTDNLDGNVPELSPVLKIHRNNEHVSAGTSIGLLISDRVIRGTNAFNPLVLETAHDSANNYSGPIIKGRRYNHGGFDGSGFELNLGNGDGLFNIVAGAHYNPADDKYSFDGHRGAAAIKFSDGSAQGVVKLFGSHGLGDPGIGVTMLQHYPPPTFYAHQTVSQTLTNNATVKVTYTTEVFDTHSAYDASTSTFTAPMSGYYWMHATLRMATVGNAMRYDMTFRKNGSASVYSGGLNQQTDNDASTMATVIMDLNKGDTVEVYVDQNGGSNETTSNTSNAGGNGMSHFTGYLVYPKDSNS